jgi:DNA-binding transcriptional LysR family regulator
VKDEKWISLRDPEGMGLEQYFYDACSGAGFQPDVVQNATDVPTVISLVSAGFGLALLPASAKAVSVENVVYVDILDRLRESELTLVCHRIIRSEVLKSFWLRSITPDVLLPAGAARAARRSPDPGCFSGASTC